MSLSDETRSQGSAVLVARGPVGVEIQVVDTNYRVRGRGTVELTLTLPGGVYMVDWTSAGRTQQRLVRLLPISRPLVVSLDEPVGSQTKSGADIAKEIGKTARPSETDHGSEVVVIVQPASHDASIDLRLLNSAEVAMRSDGADVVATQEKTAGGRVTRFYRVPPGHFRLRCMSVSGQTLDQTVPAMKDRRTMVFLRASEGRVLMTEEDSYKAVDYRGIDSTRSIVVSVPRSGASIDSAECARLAEILLHDLVAGTGSLGAAFNTRLGAADADPLLLIYAAAVVLVCLEREAAPALDDPWPGDPSSQGPYRDKWQQRAFLWLKRAMLDGAPPDISAMIWRLKAAGATVDADSSAFSNPPMLECSWFWALAQSTRDPKAIPTTAGFRAVSRSGGGTPPWLTWRPSSATGDTGDTAVEFDPPNYLQSTIDALSTKVRTLVEDNSLRGVEASIDPLAFLSPDSKAVAMRTLEVSETRPNDVSTDRAGQSAAELAVLFGAPAPLLKHKLQQTLTELDAAFGPQEASAARPANVSSRRDPPALRRMIRTPDDPNKGRFGGRSKVDHVILRASFVVSSYKDRVRVALIVECEKSLPASHEQVEFFLHDSFRPNRIAVPLRQGQATLTVTTWGGFTVGAWLPARGIELELDLATVPEAPRVILER